MVASGPFLLLDLDDADGTAVGSALGAFLRPGGDGIHKAFGLALLVKDKDLGTHADAEPTADASGLINIRVHKAYLLLYSFL